MAAAVIGEPLLFAEINNQKEESHVINGNQEELLSNLMAKLKTTSEQIKTWSNTSRKIRSVMAKCDESNTVDASRLQQCLDQLKLAIRGSMSLPAMVERLKSYARQAGMKFNTGHSPREVFISSDAFYVEIILENSGAVEDVKIFRQDEAESCPAMRDCLRQSNYNEFLDHLKGLNSFHQLQCEISMKREAFKCLQTLENDIKTLFEMSCMNTTNVLVLILSGLAGFVTPRIGGYPMRLTFFVSPYDLLNVEKRTSTVLNMSDPLPEDIGLSLSILLASSHNRKLQSSGTLYNNAHSEGKKGALYTFVPLNNSNCINTPACFLLKLNKPMPVSTTQIKRLAINQIHGISLSSAAPLNSLICRHAQDPVLPVDGKPLAQNKFYVTLPGEQHCYFISECNKDMKGVIVSTIPVTCTSQAIAIVTALRQQAVYNTLIASCVRSDTCKDEYDISLFEVSTVSQYKLTITFEHPAKIGMACVEIDILEVANVKCIIHTPEGEEPLCTNEYATKVLQKCMSIPVTMRAIMKVANSNLEKFRKPLSNSAVPGISSPGSGSSFPQNPGKGPNGGISPKPGSTTMNYISSGRMGGGNSRKTNSILFDLSNSVATFFAPKNVASHVPERTKSTDESKKAQNPMLAELLTSCTVSGSSSNSSSANPIPVTSERVYSGPKQDQPTVPTLKRKIRTTSDSKSPKQLSEGDDAVFLPHNNYKRQISTPDVSSRSSLVSDVSAVIPAASGIDLNPSLYSHDIVGYTMDSTAKRQKRSESYDSQNPSSWTVPCSESSIAWKGSGFNIDVQNKNNISSLINFQEEARNIVDSHDLPENVFSPGDDFPDLDPDDVNLLDEAVEFGKSNLNKDLSASYPQVGSGKPPMIVNRSQSTEGVVIKTEINEKTVPCVPELTPVKQPHIKSKGKPKNFKPDLEESSLSSDTSPSPPKKLKKKGKKREASNNATSLDHLKKGKKKRRIEPDKESQTTGSFTLTASSDSLKIKISRTEPKKQTPVERKTNQLPGNVKPTKITLKLHPMTGETSSVRTGQQQPKYDADKRGNVFEVFTPKTSVKSPTLEKRKVYPSEEFSKSIGARSEDKHSSIANKKIATQKPMSKGILPGQNMTMHNNDKMQSVLKKVSVMKKVSSPVNKAMLAKKPKFGSSKTISKTIMPGQRPQSSTNSSSVSRKLPSGAGPETGNKTTSGISSAKTTSLVNASKQVSGQKVPVSRPAPLTISPSISSVSSPTMASSRQVTTPLSPTSAGSQKKNCQKSPFRGRTLTSIVQVLQRKAQTQTPEDEVNEATEEVAKKREDVARPRSISLDSDNKSNLIPKVSPVVKTPKQKGALVTSPTFSAISKPSTLKHSHSTKVLPATGKSPTASIPKQNKLSPNFSRSLSSPSFANKIANPTSLKIQQRLQSPGKPVQPSRPVQKSPSSPLKPLIKTVGSPTTTPRKPNILSKAPKSTSSPKTQNISLPIKVSSPQSAVTQPARHNIATEVSKKQSTSLRTINNNSSTNIRNSSLNNNVRNNISNTSDMMKTESQKKINPVQQPAKMTHEYKSSESSKNKEELSSVKIHTNERKSPAHNIGIHDSLPKVVVPQRIPVKLDHKEVVTREPANSVTNFKVPSPAVVTNTKTASPKPVPSDLVTANISENKISTEKSNKPIQSPSVSKPETEMPNKIDTFVQEVDRATRNQSKRQMSLSPGDSLSENKPLFIDDPQEPINVNPPEMHVKETSHSVNPSSDTQTEPGSTSPRSMIAQSPLGIVASSPLGQVASPLMLPVKSPAALSGPSTQTSPCPIDDDLMDEALVSVISKEDS